MPPGRFGFMICLFYLALMEKPAAVLVVSLELWCVRIVSGGRHWPSCLRLFLGLALVAYPRWVGYFLCSAFLREVWLGI